MYKITRLKKENAQYNFIIGERSNGKSYAVKHECLKHFLETGQKFMYIRRYNTDITKSLANQYFQDLNVEKLTKGKQNYCYCQSNNIYIALHDLDTGEDSNIVHIGYVRSVAQAQRYSSGSYNDVDIMMYEEFMSLNGRYLPDEIMLFKHLVSTVSRKRDITVYFIGNTISRFCPYFKEFNVHHIAEQEQGTIDVYDNVNASGENVRVACEYCGNVATRSGMSFGADEGMTNAGKWLVHQQPWLDRTEWRELYSFIVEYDDTQFLVEYITQLVKDLRNGFAIYVSVAPPNYLEENPDTRVFTNRVNVNPFHTRGLIPCSAQEQQLLKMVKERAFFEDDLTGTEFKEVWRKLQTLDITF